ncbi:MAG TPA: hypothetical protein VN084_05785 [Methylophilaceae bacterium]|nr:hypothetical protein [Methylophilaceae bacterium]
MSDHHDHPVMRTALLVLFWAYVLIPLAWGVFETMKKAMALFA